MIYLCIPIFLTPRGIPAGRFVFVNSNLIDLFVESQNNKVGYVS
jgi:hypothetical protein